MHKRQFQELAAMLKEHRRVIIDTHHGDAWESERQSMLEVVDDIQDSIIGICNRNNYNFNQELFEEAAHYTP